MMEDVDSVDNSSITTFASLPMPDGPAGNGPTGGGFPPLHSTYLSEAESMLNEHQGVTLFCKSWIVFYRLVLRDDLMAALVRYLGKLE
jgi:hypothetical protein